MTGIYHQAASVDAGNSLKTTRRGYKLSLVPSPSADRFQYHVHVILEAIRAGVGLGLGPRLVAESIMGIRASYNDAMYHSIKLMCHSMKLM